MDRQTTSDRWNLRRMLLQLSVETADRESKITSNSWNLQMRFEMVPADIKLLAPADDI